MQLKAYIEAFLEYNQRVIQHNRGYNYESNLLWLDG